MRSAIEQGNVVDDGQCRLVLGKLRSDVELRLELVLNDLRDIRGPPGEIRGHDRIGPGDGLESFAVEENLELGIDHGDVPDAISDKLHG